MGAHTVSASDGVLTSANVMASLIERHLAAVAFMGRVRPKPAAATFGAAAVTARTDCTKRFPFPGGGAMVTQTGSALVRGVLA
ncbi:MAG TPA: hypothetical protein VNB24_05880 [Acidimicrobiales bacterium]|nr:hypothetical protein [Acidimicrobiales bacterium]